MGYEAVLSLSGHKAPLSSEVKEPPLDVSAFTEGSLKPMECQESLPTNEINVSTFFCGQKQEIVTNNNNDELVSRTKDNHSLSSSFLSCSKTSQAEAMKRILYQNDRGHVVQSQGQRSKHQKKNSCQLLKRNIIDYSVNQKYKMLLNAPVDELTEFN